MEPTVDRAIKAVAGGPLRGRPTTATTATWPHGGASLAVDEKLVPADVVEAGARTRRRRSCDGLFRVNVNDAEPKSSCSALDRCTGRRRRSRHRCRLDRTRRPLARGRHQALRRARRERRASTSTLRRGEILALLGENGAGKTTLMNILFGHYVADEGDDPRRRRRTARSRPLPPGSPQAALAAGIGMVHQHFALAESLTGPREHRARHRAAAAASAAACARRARKARAAHGARAGSRSTRTRASRGSRSARSSGSRSSRCSTATPASSSSTSRPRC